MYCHKCGTKVADDAGFCHNCGTKMVQGDIAQEPLEVPTNDEPKYTSTAEPLQQTSAAPVQTIERGDFLNDSGNDFKAFVDNHVQTTTKFQSAEDLLKNSKPWTFLCVCFGIPAIIGLATGGPVGMLIVGGLFGYAAAFVASGIIRLRHSGRFGGGFTDDISIEELIAFLTENLKHIHPDFHEWGYLSKKGLLPAVENAIAKETEEVRICSEFGPNRKHLVAFYIKPKTVDAKPGEKLYFVDALKNGLLVDGRAAGFLGHGALIRTAPVLQAAMMYHLKSKGGAE